MKHSKTPGTSNVTFVSLLFEALQALRQNYEKQAIRDSSSHAGVKAPPIWFPARADFYSYVFILYICDIYIYHNIYLYIIIYIYIS